MDTPVNATTLQPLQAFPRPVLKRCTDGSSPRTPITLTKQRHATDEEIAEAIRQKTEFEEFTALVLGHP